MSQMNLIGRTLGDFEILAELGRGAMGVVYKARQVSLNRIVAMKVLPPQFTYDESYVARFKREARSAAQLEHPAIISIYEVGERDSFHYIIMRYIEGETLRDIIQREGPMPLQRVINLIAPVVAALDYAHSQGVIHRDIKPSNIMVSRTGSIFLTDFGLARTVGGDGGLTATGMIMGTPDYMSPEQARGVGNIGAPTDIYALGIVIYQMLTNVLPFEAESTLSMLHARLIEPPKPPRTFRPDLSTAVEAVLLKALAREPEQRYQRAGEMLDALTASMQAADNQATFVVSRPSAPQQPGVPPTVITPPGGVPPVPPGSVPPVPPAAYPPPPGTPVTGDTIFTPVNDTPHPSSPGIFTPPVTPAPPPAKRQGSVLKWIGIGCGALLLLVVCGVGSLLFLASQFSDDPGVVVTTNVTPEAIFPFGTDIPVETDPSISPPVEVEPPPVDIDLPFAPPIEGDGSADGQPQFVYTSLDIPLVHDDDDFIESYKAGLSLTNFIVEAEFTNPYSPTESDWDYGFLFRDTGNDEAYRLMVTSDQRWILIQRSAGEFRQIDSGALTNVFTDGNATNWLRLEVNQGNATLFVNDELITSSLDLSDKIEAGDVGVATGFLQNSEIPGAITQVSNFLIWSLDGYVRADNWTGNLIAAENFDGPDAGGWNDTRDWADYRVVDGIYYIDVKQPDTLAISSMSEEVTSFLMEADVTIVSAGDMSGGLLFNNSEAGYYALLIDASGAYSVRKNINGTQSVIQDWTPHFAIHTDGSANRLLVIRDAKTGNIRMHINTRHVGTWIDTDLQSGKTGVAANSGTTVPATVAFDNFRTWLFEP